MWKKGFIEASFRSLARSKAPYAIGDLVFVSYTCTSFVHVLLDLQQLLCSWHINS